MSSHPPLGIVNDLSFFIEDFRPIMEIIEILYTRALTRVRVRVRACVRARVRARVCARSCVCVRACVCTCVCCPVIRAQ